MATLVIKGKNGFVGKELKINAEPLIIYVCGYWNKNIPYAGTEWGVNYWGPQLKNKAKNYFKTTKELFINGAGTKFSNGKDRLNQGSNFANERLKNTSSKFYKEVFNSNRKVMIVSHSMGGAFAEGMLKVLLANSINVQKVLHLSAADTSDFTINLPEKTYQIDITWDPVLMYKNADDFFKIKGIKYSALVKNPNNDKFGHMYTKEEAFVWNWFEDLEKINLTFIRDEVRYIRQPSDGLGPGLTTTLNIKKYKSSNLLHNTQFIRILKDTKLYHGLNNDNYETYV